MRTPTLEQQRVIDNPSRVRLVRAAPGSGKTWLVAEIIRRELANWNPNQGGIAALSFTRVGGEEIRRAIESEIVHPHFVGTLDSFLFRYVVRPYLQQACPGAARPRLVPAEWCPEEWSKPPAGIKFNVRHGGGKGATYNAFKARFIGEESGQIRLGYPEAFGSGLRVLDGPVTQSILGVKKQLWSKLGWLTHSDAAFLAALILANTAVGSTVLAELTRRFSFIVVDELQDTGWFLGQSMKSILSVGSTRGILVGDPDQAIYEFNGARPDLFDGFSEITDAKELPLNMTRRCGAAICRVAEQLSETGRVIQPAIDRLGRAVLLRYTDLSRDIARLRRHLGTQPGTTCIRMIARDRKTIAAIAGKEAAREPLKLGSAPLNHMQRAVTLFRTARQAQALAAARAALELVVFGSEGREEVDLFAYGIRSEEWKKCAVECLLSANEELVGESLYDWGLRVADVIRRGVDAFATRSPIPLDIPAIRKPKSKHKTEERSGFLFKAESVVQAAQSVPLQTVHAVKGETHDMTVLVCPPPRRAARCPSAVWWSEDVGDKEERRIAYVAATRTRGDLILCVCEETWVRLRTRRPAFVALCECLTVDSFLGDGSG